MFKIDTKGKKFKRNIDILYGLGAAIVIMGALFKIIHLKFADEMLILGLTTEAVIFAVSAFIPSGKDYEWELVYPELDYESDYNNKGPKGTGTPTQELDRMLEEAKIGPELLDSLSAGMRRLSDTAASLNSATDAAGATASYSQQLGAAAKNMEALNALYAVQLENTTSQVEIQNTVMEKLSASAQNTDALAGEVAKLSQNLSQLNSVYGNMLAAMNVRS
jgi:gliding motility-associated protein GldL